MLQWNRRFAALFAVGTVIAALGGWGGIIGRLLHIGW
jgi:hypothetical protein